MLGGANAWVHRNPDLGKARMKTMLTRATRVLVAGIPTTLMLSGTANAADETTDLLWFDGAAARPPG